MKKSLTFFLTILLITTLASCTKVCNHKLSKIEAEESTYYKNGVKSHYVCYECGKLFLDEFGTEEVSKYELILEKVPLDVDFSLTITGDRDINVVVINSMEEIQTKLSDLQSVDLIVVCDSSLLSIMDNYEIPWIPYFESYEDIIDEIKSSSFCILAKASDLTNQNYAIGFIQNSIMTNTLFVINEENMEKISMQLEKITYYSKETVFSAVSEKFPETIMNLLSKYAIFTIY